MQVEGVTELVRFRLLEPFAETAFLRQRVIAEALPAQAGVDLAERLQADHARTPGRQFPFVPVGADVPRLVERLEQLLEVLQRIPRLVAEQLLEQILVDPFEVASPLGRLDLADQFIELAHLRHEAHRGFQVDILPATETVARSSRIEGRHRLGKALQFGLKLRVVETVGQQRL